MPPIGSRALVRCAPFVLLPALLSCSVDPAQDIPSWNQATYRFHGYVTSTELFVLILDDTASPAAERLRSDVRRVLEATLRDRWSRAAQGACTDHPVDWCAVVVLPSGPRDARLVGPETHPDLCVRWQNAPDSVAAELTERIFAVTEQNLASGVSPFRPLEAASDALALLFHHRSPTTTAEATLQELGRNPYLGTVKTLLAVSRDDASPGEPGDYSLPLTTHGPPWVEWLAVLPTDGRSCRGDVPAVPRLDLALPPYDGRMDWPCDDAWSSAEDSILWGSGSDGGPACFHRPVRRDAAGTPLCHAEVILFDPAALCEPTRGWVAPAGSPEPTPRPRVGPFGPEYVCDLLPLTGEARVRCETELQPLTCESGYCIPESLPLTSHCADDAYGTLRLQGRAAPPFGGIELTCDFE